MISFIRKNPQIVGLLRIAVACCAISALTAYVYKWVTGELMYAWQTALISAWFAEGCVLLSSRLPATMKEVWPLMVKATIWPWFLSKDATLSFTEKKEKFQLVAMLLMTIGAWGFYRMAPSSTQLPPYVESLSTFVLGVGLVAICWWMVQSLILESSVMYGAIGIYWRVILLSVGIASIKYYSKEMSDLLIWIQSNTESVITGVVAVLFVRFLFGMAPRPNASVAAREMEYGRAAGKMSLLRSKPTKRDERVTVAHEAGHALLYAALGRIDLPDEFQMVVHESGDSGVLGSVSSVDWNHLLAPRAFSEWKMLVYLAGQIGEEVLLGESALGASSDMGNWQFEAKKYLSNGFGPMYFNQPDGPLELARNCDALEALRAGQRALLTRFLDENKVVLKELADALAEKRTLGKGDVLPFLNRVVLADGMPKLAGLSDGSNR